MLNQKVGCSRSNNTDAFWLLVNDLENVDLPDAYTNPGT